MTRPGSDRPLDVTDTDPHAGVYVKTSQCRSGTRTSHAAGGRCRARETVGEETDTRDIGRDVLPSGRGAVCGRRFIPVPEIPDGSGDGRPRSFSRGAQPFGRVVPQPPEVVRCRRRERPPNGGIKQIARARRLGRLFERGERRRRLRPSLRWHVRETDEPLRSAPRISALRSDPPGSPGLRKWGCRPNQVSRPGPGVRLTCRRSRPRGSRRPRVPS
jgi:hypothetical protein